MAVLPPKGHQPGHFLLGQLDFFSAPIGQRKISYFVRQLRFCFNLRHGSSFLVGGETGQAQIYHTMIRIRRQCRKRQKLSGLWAGGPIPITLILTGRS